jgi:hypothetical protein
MSSHLNDFPLFLGHFHPMLAHLPVGGLVLLGILELLAMFPRFKDAARNRRVILGVVAAGTAVTAGCGWLLSQAGGYDAQLLFWHRLTGFGLAGACAVTLLLCGSTRQCGYRLSLLTTLVLLVVAGHFGSTITHGRGFFTRYAPAPLRFFLGEPTPPIVTASPPADVMQRRLFAEVVRPILQQRCLPCHGPEKQKGGLRLDSLAALREGGENGPAFVGGKPDESLMIQRLLLPLDDEDHMPPEGKPQPTPDEIGLLEWWINAGAPEDGTVESFKPGADARRMLEAVAARQVR